MITLLKLDGKWIGTGGLPGPLDEARVFTGPAQREDAWNWSKAQLGASGRFTDRLTLLMPDEVAAAQRIVCTCGKMMQAGAGPVSHGLCGKCCRAMIEGMEALK